MDSNNNKQTIVTGYPANTYTQQQQTNYLHTNGAPTPPPSHYPPPPPSHYPPPPSSHFPPPPYYPPPPSVLISAPPRRLLVRRFLYLCIGLFILFGIITLIIWIVLKPRIPQIDVKAAHITDFNVSDASNLINANFDFNLTVRNPSAKMTILYDRVVAAVLYGDATIAESSLSPFYQDRGNVTSILARLVASSEYVGPEVVSGIENERRSGGDGEVKFNLRILSWVRFRSGVWGTRRHLMRAYCDDLPIGLKNSTTGTMSGDNERKCLVYL